MSTNLLSFFLVDPSERDLAAAQEVMHLHGIEFSHAELRLPESVDLRYTDADMTAFLAAELAFHRLGGATPVLAIRSGLRIFALNDLPGSAIAFAIRMFGIAEIVRRVDKAGGDRRCVLEKVAYYHDPALGTINPDFRFLPRTSFYPDGTDRPETKLPFSALKQVRGKVATWKQLELLEHGPQTVEDLFVPDGFDLPLSLLSTETHARVASFHDEVFLDLVPIIEQSIAFRIASEDELARSAVDDMGDADTHQDLIIPAAEGEYHDEPTVIISRDDLPEELRAAIRASKPDGPGVYRQSGEEETVVPPESARRSSRSVPTVQETDDSDERRLDELFSH